MLGGLFARLTKRPARADRGRALFIALIGIAREPGWYRDGEVPDTVDGRFAVLATVVALALVRIETSSDQGRESSAALTERFVEAMDHEHRQMGIGDPTLGKTVRKLVGRLANRVELWRSTVGASDWAGAVRESLYRDQQPPAEAIRFSERRLRQLWATLGAASDEALATGEVQ